MAGELKTTHGVKMYSMDAELWGTLQYHIGLQSVYTKLPLEEFFQLRVVCKDWNQLASDRRFLEKNFTNPIPKSYFYFNARLKTDWNGSREHGFLAYSVTSDRWRWTRLPSGESGDKGLMVEGLIYTEYLDSKFRSRRKVFNMHSRVWHDVPPSQVSDSFATPFDMMVDTSVNPYTFKLIHYSYDVETHIYDSKTNLWEKRSSRLCNLGTSRYLHMSSFAQCEGLLYIWPERANKIAVYDMEKDLWSSLDEPTRISVSTRPAGFCCSLGAWQGRLFCLHENDDDRKFTIWELVSQSKQEWMEYTCMPCSLYGWLSYFKTQLDEVKIRCTEFSNECVLVYAWHCKLRKADRFVLFDMETRRWRGFLPFRTIENDKFPRTIPWSVNMSQPILDKKYG